MKDLYSVFQDLPIPQSTEEHVYSAVPIQGFETHRIAKDHQDIPTILISVSPEAQAFIIPRQKLYHLSITHNLACEIHANAQKEQRTFSVIRYEGKDQELKKYFLKICEILIPSLGCIPDHTHINHTVNQFIELFKRIKEPSNNTLQGLWAELFFIQQASDPKILVRAWHIRPEESYDFSLGQLRIEVKSAGTRNRTHHFSLKQLQPPAQSTLYIASLFVEVLAGGQSIEDLLNDIIHRLDNDVQLIEKLNLITYTTLGGLIDEAKYICYDAHLAKQSLQFYRASDIPKVQSVPTHVFDVTFKSDINTILPSKKTIETLLLNSSNT